MKSTRRSFLKTVGAMSGGLVVAGLAPTSSFGSRKDLVTSTRWAMGMPVSYTADKSVAVNVLSAAHAAVQRVDGALSVYKSESAISRLNNLKGGYISNADLVKVSKAALDFGEMTNGRLDVSVLPALRSYGFRPGSASASAIDFRNINVTPNGVSLAGGIQIDLGGIAKGYAVDEAVDSLRLEGVTTGLVEAGGDIYAIGSRPDGSDWKIGIRDPHRPDQLFAAISVSNSAVATSGGYVDSRTVNGKKVSHLIDPATGLSVNHVLSATVVAPTAMEADALATATSIQSPEEAQAMVERLAGVEAVWLYSDGSRYITSGLRSRMTLL